MIKKISGILFLAFSLGLFSSSLWAEQPDKLTAQGFVNDYAHILQPQEAAALEKLGRALQSQTTAELAFVSIQSLENISIEEFAVKLFEHWKLGQKGKDNGVLLLVAMKDHKMRIEVGYGLEGTIPDAQAGDIIRAMSQYFKAHEMTKGVEYGYISLLEKIAKEYRLDPKAIWQTAQMQQVQLPRHKKKGNDTLSGILFLLIMILVFSGRMGILPFLFLGSMGGRSSGGYWSGGGGGSGFGGFGGGFSGGGGASGSW